MPGISLRTVYQTLTDLIEMGELQPVTLGTGAARFDPNVADHHHGVCDVCGAILDVYVDGSDSSSSTASIGSPPAPPRSSSTAPAPPAPVRRPSNQPNTPTRSTNMADLNGTKTHENLKEAFAGESQANRRYLWFAQKADIEGYPDSAALFRSVAEGETGHAHGHLEYFAEVGDPASGEPIGDTEENFKASIAGETYEYTQMYPGFAKTARDEGFDEIADWFETLARAEKSHAGRFTQGLEAIS